jgi:hypothetical protein
VYTGSTESILRKPRSVYTDHCEEGHGLCEQSVGHTDVMRTNEVWQREIQRRHRFLIHEMDETSSKPFLDAEYLKSSGMLKLNLGKIKKEKDQVNIVHQERQKKNKNSTVQTGQTTENSAKLQCFRPRIIQTVHIH